MTGLAHVPSLPSTCKLVTPALVAPLYTTANSSGSRHLSVSDVSLTAWANVLLAFGVEPNRTTIAAYLLPSAARIPPHSAGDEIYNLEDVSRVLTKLNRTDLLTATHSGVKG